VLCRRPCLCVLALALPLVLDGCALAVVGGVAAAGAAGGYSAAQERGLTGSFDDLSVKSRIQQAWAAAIPPLGGNIEATVYEGRTLLVGSVPTPEARARADDIARRTNGVRAVYDEIAVGPAETAWDATQDAWISTRLRSDLLLDNRVRSFNYTIDTVDRTVYLIGSARTRHELDVATTLARNLPGVRRVVSFVEIRPGVPAIAGPPAPPPPAALEGASPAMAAPVTAVQSQKL
jgi:osmotically-inducible protein OsmY